MQTKNGFEEGSGGGGAALSKVLWFSQEGGVGSGFRVQGSVIGNGRDASSVSRPSHWSVHRPGAKTVPTGAAQCTLG